MDLTAFFGVTEPRGLPKIPSELLEPTITYLVECWMDQVMIEEGTFAITPEVFKERLTALSMLTSECGAIHATLAIGNLKSKLNVY